jgi:metastasis-associated protein MTA
MDTLHKSAYELSKAYASLVPTGGPVLCRDEMEEWSASEANLFEEALDKYGKDFNDIRQDFVSTFIRLLIYIFQKYML